MVDFRGISPARQPQAIHTVPDTMPKTQSSFYFFTFRTWILFTHALWTTHSRERYILHNSFSIEFHFLPPLPLFFFKTHTLQTPAPNKRYKAQKYMQVLFLYKLRSQTYNNSNTHTKHTNMLQNKILKSVTDTWSNAHMIPNKTTLNKLLPAGRGKKMEAAGFEEKEGVYMMSVPRKDEAGDGTIQEGAKNGSQQPFITLEGDRGLRGAEW